MPLYLHTSDQDHPTLLRGSRSSSFCSLFESRLLATVDTMAPAEFNPTAPTVLTLAIISRPVSMAGATRSPAASRSGPAI
mmetsp:Transcript_27631/g.79761  ORF Transcript_27631/g.79761 Transcript_27631/m.79761 type:complete len:80 (+) Transcript_27631:203-442(+)